MKITNKKIASKKSSVAWLQRQAADPYVARAHKDGYRARAAYKLIEMNEKFKFLRNGQVVVDLGMDDLSCQCGKGLAVGEIGRNHNLLTGGVIPGILIGGGAGNDLDRGQVQQLA